MTLTIRTAFESLMSLPKTTLIYLAVHYSSAYTYVTATTSDEPRTIKQETLLSVSQPEIVENYHNEKWWKYIYETTKHYVSPDTPVYYMSNVNNTDNKVRMVKIFVCERNPLNKIAFDLKNFEEEYYEFKEYGGNGKTEIYYIDKLAEILAEYVIKTEVVRPSTVEYFSDVIYDKLDDWRTTIIDPPTHKTGRYQKERYE